MSRIFHSDECVYPMLDILTVILNTPKKPAGTHFSSTVDHGVSEIVSLQGTK